jgi:three-Cys-motif partner protein
MRNAPTPVHRSASSHAPHHTWQVGQILHSSGHLSCKHRVLRAYLERYVSTLTSNVRQERLKLTLVDGFAGGGRIRQPNERGTTGIAVYQLAMRCGQECGRHSIQAVRTRRCLLFHREESRSIDLPQKRHSGIRIPRNHRRKHSDPGEFVAHVAAVIESIKKRGPSGRSIFVLDQFGYSEYRFYNSNHSCRASKRGSDFDVRDGLTHRLPLEQ